MANEEHLAILGEGVDAWNQWRLENPELAPNLVQADLKRADLRGAELMKADLRGANLREANLERARLAGADLAGAVLLDVKLRFADLSGAYVRATSLAGASLEGTRLRGTTFADVDFRRAKDLDRARHDGPSSIGLDSIYLSEGHIPESFLRGCGVPENFITYVKSLTGAALDFYSVFISYSAKDQTFADRLHADLQARGVRCWFAAHDIRGGRKIYEQIDEAIRVYDKLLLILSDASMTSDWVAEEIARARKHERRENRRMLFPISIVPYDAVRDWQRFDADAGKDSAREVREYFIPDFSAWKDHDSYSRAFERLLRDLKAGLGDKPEVQPAQ
jgi:uncharacterized protein YjbI with pentapeptide repeats